MRVAEEHLDAVLLPRISQRHPAYTESLSPTDLTSYFITWPEDMPCVAEKAQLNQEASNQVSNAASELSDMAVQLQGLVSQYSVGDVVMEEREAA